MGSNKLMEQYRAVISLQRVLLIAVDTTDHFLLTFDYGDPRIH